MELILIVIYSLLAVALAGFFVLVFDVGGVGPESTEPAYIEGRAGNQDSTLAQERRMAASERAARVASERAASERAASERAASDAEAAEARAAEARVAVAQARVNAIQEALNREVAADEDNRNALVQESLNRDAEIRAARDAEIEELAERTDETHALLNETLAVRDRLDSYIAWVKESLFANSGAAAFSDYDRMEQKWVHMPREAERSLATERIALGKDDEGTIVLFQNPSEDPDAYLYQAEDWKHPGTGLEGDFPLGAPSYQYIYRAPAIRSSVRTQI